MEVIYAMGGEMLCCVRWRKWIVFLEDCCEVMGSFKSVSVGLVRRGRLFLILVICMFAVQWNFLSVEIDNVRCTLKYEVPSSLNDVYACGLV